MKRIATVLAALITMGTAANATTLASGASFGGPTQSSKCDLLHLQRRQFSSDHCRNS